MAQEDLSTKTVCFVDNGLFTAFARKVAPAFKKAYYYVPWQKAFVRSRELSVGIGFPEIERVRSALRLVDKVDLWVFLDQFHDDLQWLIEEKFGGRVWGARDAEELELYRWEARRVFKELGLPVLPAEHIIGMPALREHLQRTRDRWIKNSFNVGGRADMETWKHLEYTLSKPRLDQLEYDLGPGLSEVYEFISEADHPKAVEIGYDGPSVDGDFPNQGIQAFEVKGLGMFAVAKPYQLLAEPVRIVNAALSPVLRQYRYRGMLSTEIRWGKDRKPNLIDPCCRLGSPSNELLQEMMADWPRTIWEGAGGILVPQRVLFKYGVVVMAYSEFSGTNNEALYYPKALDNWVKLRNPAVFNGVRYTIPQGQPQNIAGIVGVGNTMLEAVHMASENAKQVKGDRVQISMESIGKALDEIQEAEKYGIKFAEDRRYPTLEQLKAAVQ